MDKNKIILYETADHAVKLNVSIDGDTVWLNRAQLAELFDRDVKTIGKHINNALKEELVSDDSVVVKFATTAADGKIYQVDYYNLDVIISVGYRVKSQRGVEFRKWANSVLKDYIIKGYAVNNKRIEQIGEVIRIMKRAENQLDAKQVLSVIEKFNVALDLLDAYDHQTLNKPKGNKAVYVLDYDECRKVINAFHFAQQGNDVTATDITPRHVDIMEEIIAQKGIGMKTAVLDACDMSVFDDESFDVVLNMGPFYHLIDEEKRVKCLNESMRVLKKGGILVTAYIPRYYIFQLIAMQIQKATRLQYQVAFNIYYSFISIKGFLFNFF